ncbi:MAG: phosphoribosyltransferase family protein [Bacteroidales bacterium]|mgnify:FL=1|jgi:ComF family protein|nr:phosphoribosyltransferase family protein [Bacteroidota bacterium]MDY0400244.1 phosphoribosyltransferase family protein [Bacteroidales bacterium]HHW59287.1 ComF family protein [Bacteroidales bacterium]HOB77501.1 phosphoribosyltransferase family protein [Bacteroidales bacterium]HQD58665.1 phosphoribosyltransferase family protein [Bacteroidales bacterium]
MDKFVTSFFNILFPKTCVSCENPIYDKNNILCSDCFSKLGFTYYKNFVENPLYEKFIGQANIEYAYALCYFYKDGILQHCLHALKYKGHKDVGTFFGKLIGYELNDIDPPVDIIIPVPLHPKKEKVRGYNQAEMIAKGVSKVLKIPIAINIIKRTKFTETQTKKTKWERYDNLNGVFAIQNSKSLANKHVLIVDDVITTGATTVSLIDLLKDIENIKISVACIGTPDKI